MTTLRRSSGASYANPPTGIKRSNGASFVGGPGSKLYRSDGVNWDLAWRWLEQVTGLAVAVAGTNQLNLSWSAVTGADGYKVERSLTGTSGWAVVQTTVSTAWNNSGLDDGLRYYYQVRPYIEHGAGVLQYGAYSTVQNNVTTLKAPVLTSAVKGAGDPTSEGDLVLTDGGSVTETAIRVYVSTTSSSSGFSLHTTLPANDLEETIVGLNDNVQHWVKLRNYDSVEDAESADSVVRTFTTDLAPPSQVTGLTVIPKANTDDILTASWDASTDAAEYDLHVSTTPSFTPGPGNLYTTTTDPDVDAEITGLAPDTKRYAQVIARNTGGSAPASAEASGRTHREAPGLTAPQKDADCPSFTFTLTFDHDNTDGDSRGTTIEWQRNDSGVWGSTNTLGGGTATYEDTGASIDTDAYRARYQGETLWATKTVFPTCPE